MNQNVSQSVVIMVVIVQTALDLLAEVKADRAKTAVMTEMADFILEDRIK